MTKSDKKRQKWYIGGLHFECSQCGDCCAGPTPGFIWVTAEEIRFIAEHLGLSVADFRQRFVKQIGNRTTLIEEKPSNDCIFLTNQNGQRGCAIYPVRPNQCRTWPFWKMNLESPDTWNFAAQRCPGINRGRHFSCEEIEKRKSQKRWWADGQGK